MTHSFPTRRSSDLWIQHRSIDQADVGAFEQPSSGDRHSFVSFSRPTMRSSSAISRPLLVDKCNKSSATSVPGSTGISFCAARSEEHTSELQSLMRTSYAVFCLKKKKNSK